MAHIRQSRPDYGLGFQVKVLRTFQVVPFSLGSGSEALTRDTLRHMQRLAPVWIPSPESPRGAHLRSPLPVGGIPSPEP